ncbi:MAG: hypothetical protein BGN86_06315 [Caulobacterales bacterium 68-7]|nr:MAG: hypothetical protein BGN86_06315 [Caulobacterales bacterium 68-7]
MMPPGIPGGAFGPPSIALRDALFGQQLNENRRRTAPPVARFVSENGESFTLDRSSNQPLLRFDGSGEVWALEASAAPRGDTIYKNDLGEPVLRATRLGGLTVFTNSQPSGMAAALLGNGQPLRLPAISPQELIITVARATERIGRAAKHSILITIDASDEGAPLVADAANRAADAIVKMAGKRANKPFVDKIAKIDIREGRKPSATMSNDGVVRILVTPDMGVAGRPSSERIMLASRGK